jgi:hypothetical protein
MAQDAAYQSQQEIADLQAQVAAMQAQQVQAAVPPAPPPVAAPPMGGGSDMMSQLQQLGEMKQAGLLSDEEFQAAKARLLAG